MTLSKICFLKLVPKGWFIVCFFWQKDQRAIIINVNEEPQKASQLRNVYFKLEELVPRHTSLTFQGRNSFYRTICFCVSSSLFASVLITLFHGSQNSNCPSLLLPCIHIFFFGSDIKRNVIFPIELIRGLTVLGARFTRSSW